VGARQASAREGLCDGVGSRGDCLGRWPYQAGALCARKTVCIIHPEHVRSIRVAEKCGFKEVQRTTYKGEPTILFAR